MCIRVLRGHTSIHLSFSVIYNCKSNHRDDSCEIVRTKKYVDDRPKRDGTKYHIFEKRYVLFFYTHLRVSAHLLYAYIVNWRPTKLLETEMLSGNIFHVFHGRTLNETRGIDLKDLRKPRSASTQLLIS